MDPKVRALLGFLSSGLQRRKQLISNTSTCHRRSSGTCSSAARFAGLARATASSVVRPHSTPGSSPSFSRPASRRLATFPPRRRSRDPWARGACARAAASRAPGSPARAARRRTGRSRNAARATPAARARASGRREIPAAPWRRQQHVGSHDPERRLILLLSEDSRQLNSFAQGGKLGAARGSSLS